MNGMGGGRKRRGVATMHVIGAGLGLTLVLGCAESEAVDRLPPPTEADLLSVDPEDAYAEYRDELTSMIKMRHPDAELPTPERVRFILPEEWATTMQECLANQGFQSTVSGDGGLEYEGVPTEQALALNVANYSCSLQYPVDPRYTAELSAYQLEYLYEYYVLDLVPCLEEEGVSVSEPPSFQKFRDTWETEDAWSPYSSVDPGSQSKWDQLNKTCPQNPDDLFGE